MDKRFSKTFLEISTLCHQITKDKCGTHFIHPKSVDASQNIY